MISTLESDLAQLEQDMADHDIEKYRDMEVFEPCERPWYVNSMILPMTWHRVEFLKAFRDETCYHREDGPAYVLWNPAGKIERMKWYLNGRLHREDGASSYGINNGNPYFWFQINGEPHRVAAPAHIFKNGEGDFQCQMFYRGYLKTFWEYYEEYQQWTNSSDSNEVKKALIRNWLPYVKD